jgi:hypothetical protein
MDLGQGWHDGRGTPLPLQLLARDVGKGGSSGESGHELNAGVDWPGDAFMGGSTGPNATFRYCDLCDTLGKTEV